ncbi:MAG TPA: sodium:solute symporter family protein [Syntrophomonadaceae bacterium]|nr:sodium:solute symporter family protein [Syntrophomonadaceae bacterium]
MKTQYIIFAYLLLTLGIGVYMARTNKTVQDMFIAKSGLPILLIIPLVFGEVLGGTGTVGGCAQASSGGLSAAWATWGIGLGLVAYVLFFSKFFRVTGATRGVMSLAEGYELLFDRRAKVVMLLIVAIVYGILFALQPVAAAAILAPMFGIDHRLMLVIVGVLFIIIATAGGLKGVAWVNVIHSFVMYLGLLIVAWMAVSVAGGINAVKIAAPSHYFSLVSPSVGTVVIWLLAATLSQMNSALMVSVTLGGKTLRVANRGMVFAAALLIPFALLPAIIGVVAHVVIPGVPPHDALYVLSASMSPWLGGLASMAVIAAIFSSGPALLLVVSTTLTQDLFKGFIKPNASEKETVIFARLATVVVGFLAIYLASKTTSIFSSMLGAFQIRAIAGVVLLLGLKWSRVNADAAFWSILFGGGVAAVWFFSGSPFGIQPLLPALLIGLVILVTITLMSREPISEGCALYQELLEKYNNIGEEGLESLEQEIALTKDKK